MIADLEHGVPLELNPRYSLAIVRGVDVDAVIAEVESLFAETGRQAMSTKCMVHHHRSWVPIEVHHMWPLGDGGPDRAWNKIPICANAHSAVHDLLDKMRKGKGDVPWPVRVHYGAGVRQLTTFGWEQIVAHPKAA